MRQQNLFFDPDSLKKVGKNVIIGQTVRIRHPERVEIGDNCIIDDFTYVSTGLKMGKNCHIAAGVNISGGGGNVTLGNYVGISAGSSIHASSAGFTIASLDSPAVPEALRFGGSVEDIELDDFVALGAHTIVMPGVHMPEGSATAAQTVLRKKTYEPWTLYGGADATFLCKRRHQRINQMRAAGLL